MIWRLSSPFSAVDKEVIFGLCLFHDVFVRGILHVSCLIHPVVLQPAHVIVKCGVWDPLKVSLEEDCVHIVHGLSPCFELCEILIEIGVNLINISVVFYRVLRELTKVCSECGDSCLAIKSGESHDCLVHERGNNLGLTVDENLIILAIGKQCCFGLLGEAVVETAPHLFVVFRCSLVCMMPVARMKGSQLS